MATLDQKKIKELWEAPTNKAAIERAALDNQRQLFHAQLSVDRSDSNPYLRVFLDRVQGILNNNEKFNKFDNLLTFPLASNHLISKATDEWNKVFKAQDRSEEYKFVDEATYNDFYTFLDNINFKSTIEQNLFTKVKQAVNTVAVVDIPQLEDMPQDGMATPYVYFVETGNLHDVKVDESGKILYVMFKRGTVKDENLQLVVIDDTYYRVFDINDGDLVERPIVESPHDLGFCPASFIWQDVINPDEPIRRYNSVLEIVDYMDEYVMRLVFLTHIELYASFPIMWKYSDDCEVDDVVTSDRGTPVLLDQYGGAVPASSQTPYMGPGLQIEMTVPQGESAKMSVPAGFVDVSRTLLDYNREAAQALEFKIYKHLTGVDNEVQNEKAFNESQVRSRYETRHAVLRYWAENMQYIHKFLVTTIAKLRYGDKFISANIDYGSDYFLYDTITAESEYETAKNAGLPQFIIASKRKIVMHTVSQHSTNMQERFNVLEQLEPYLDINLSDLDPTTPEYELKSNFASYIDRFERENGDIVAFGSEADFNFKINSIKTTLYNYVNETKEFQKRNRDVVRQTGQQTAV